MQDLLTLLHEARHPLSLGSVTLPLREYWTALQTASRGGKRILYAELRGVTAALGPTMADSERSWLRDRLAGHTELPPFEAERRDLLRRLEGVALAASPVPGRVNILFVSSRRFRGRPFGLVQPLDIVTEPGG